MSQRTAARGITLDHVWLAAAVALLLAGPLLTPVPPNDLWFHMATGRITATTGQIPTADSFSYTQAGAPFFNQGWLAQLLLFGLYSAGGVPLLLVAHALTILLAYGLLLRLCTIRAGNTRLGIAVFLVSLPVAFASWNIRPQTFALPLFMGFLTVLYEHRTGRASRLWLLPVLMALWVNIHGTFVLGLALIGITWVAMLFTNHERRTTDDGVLNAESAEQKPAGRWFAAAGRWPLVVWGCATALAVLLNPRGFGVIGYVRNLLGTSSVTDLVTEWAPPTIRTPDGAVFFVFVIVLVALLVYGRRRPDFADMLALAPFLWLALGANRNMVWFHAVAAPVLAAQAGSLLRGGGRPARGASGPNGLLIGLLGLLVAVSLPWVKPALFPPPLGGLLRGTPVEAVAFLRADTGRPVRLFHTEAYGSYLAWAAPEQKVFIDPRIELYPAAQWRDYISLSAAVDVETLVRRYGLDGMLLDKLAQAPLVDALRENPAWQVRYEDAASIYLVRR